MITPSIELFLREALDKSPREYGLAQPSWTTRLLRKVIKRRYKCEVSDECIRQHLHAVDGVCRRPTWTVRHRASQPAMPKAAIVAEPSAARCGVAEDEAELSLSDTETLLDVTRPST
jgi:hypothetical protein